MFRNVVQDVRVLHKSWTVVQLRSYAIHTQTLEQVFGPRSVYDSAYKEGKLLKKPYEEILALPDLLKGAKDDAVTAFTSDELLMIYMIMNRAPKLTDAALAKTRKKISRQVCYKSAKLNNQSAMLLWSRETLVNPNNPQAERSEAMQMLTDLATKKVGTASFLIADELWRIGKEKAAMKAYRLAGEQGVSKSYTKLGLILEKRGHLKQAKAAYKQAADEGDPNGLFSMSTMCTDERERIGYLQKAASAGKAEAAYNLGGIYRLQGQLELAAEYYELSAMKGLQPGQFNLAALRRQEGNFAEAEKWYLQAIKSEGDIAAHATVALHEMKASKEYKEQGSGSCQIM